MPAPLGPESEEEDPPSENDGPSAHTHLDTDLDAPQQQGEHIAC